MALIACPECKTQVSDHAKSCPSCGYPIAKSEPSPSFVAAPAIVAIAKSRGVYIILGLLFGGLGFHDFYAGYNGKGAAKLAIFCIPFLLDVATGFATGFSLIAAVINSIWALASICTVTEDAKGNAFA